MPIRIAYHGAQPPGRFFRLLKDRAAFRHQGSDRFPYGIYPKPEACRFCAELSLLTGIQLEHEASGGFASVMNQSRTVLVPDKYQAERAVEACRPLKIGGAQYEQVQYRHRRQYPAYAVVTGSMVGRSRPDDFSSRPVSPDFRFSSRRLYSPEITLTNFGSSVSQPSRIFAARALPV